MSDDAWNATSQAEPELRNARFLDAAVARDSELWLATPAGAARPGPMPGYTWELQYLFGRGYVLGPAGTSLVRAGA